MKKLMSILVISIFALAGCSSSTEQITVLTNRTDLVDNLFKEYETDFESTHEGVDIVFEPLDNYEDVTNRLSTGDYGDVLLIPSSLSSDQYQEYFLPLGTSTEVGETYGYTTKYTVDDQVYGVPTSISMNGIVYNSEVFNAAGVTEYPTTVNEALDELQKVKDNTDATPLYTNYGSAWPLGEWTYKTELGISQNPNWRNEMLTDAEPFSPGKPIYESLSLLVQAVERGLVEEDPATSDWDQSKMLIANGDVAAMVIGSWAVPQIYDLVDDASAVKFGPMPKINSDGTYIMEVSPDYGLAINKNTDNPELAKEFGTYFLDHYAVDTASLPPKADLELPEYFTDSVDYDLVELANMDPEQQAVQEKLKQSSMIDLNDSNVTQKVIEAGLGNSDLTFDEYMEQLNQQWSEAVEGN